MKKIILAAMLLLSSLLVSAQSAFTVDAATNKGDGVKSITFTGTLNGTDTLTSSEFKLYDCETVFDFWSYHGENADSVKIKVLRQYKMFGDNWITAKTVYAADSLLTMRVLSDTLANNPIANRYIFLGVQAAAGAITDNGFNKSFNYMVRAPLK